MKKDKRKNPLVSFVIDALDFKHLKLISTTYGVSVAQVARGYFRVGLGKKPGGLAAIKFGKMEDLELTSTNSTSTQ